MADRLQFFSTSRPLSDAELAEMGRHAQLEKERLLASFPQLQPFQQEIDRRLAAAGPMPNRLAVLGFMMEAKLDELREHLEALQNMTARLARAR